MKLNIFLDNIQAKLSKEWNLRLQNLKLEQLFFESFPGSLSMCCVVLSLGILLLLCWWHGRDLGVLQLHSRFALKDGAAVGEWSRLVCLLGQLAFRVGLGQGPTVLNQFQEMAGILCSLRFYTSGSTTKWGEFPGLARLHSRTSCGSEAHSGEI